MRLHFIVVCVVVACVIAVATPAAAQDRPFLFSISTVTPEDKPNVRFDYDVRVGERAFQSDDSTQPEQRIGLQASFGRLTFLGRVGIAEVGSSYQSNQSGEVLLSMLGSASPVALAAGAGVMHEAGGVNVLLARVVAGHDAPTWRLHGNVLFQKPMSAERDAVDLITSVGWPTRSLTACRSGSRPLARTSKASGKPKRRKAVPDCSLARASTSRQANTGGNSSRPAVRSFIPPTLDSRVAHSAICRLRPGERATPSRCRYRCRSSPTDTSAADPLVRHAASHGTRSLRRCPS
jgi:hypothetical protein